MTVQVPTARSSRSWGIGDLADVRAIGEWIAGRGGQVVALSPLHAPTPVAPIAASPYYPSSRRWRSPLLIRVDEVGTLDRDVLRARRPRRAALLADPLVRRDECWARQRAALEHLWVRLGDGQRARGRPLATSSTAPSSSGGRRSARWPRPRTDWRQVARRPATPRLAGRRAGGRATSPTGWRSTRGCSSSSTSSSTRARASGVRLLQDLAVGVDPGGADAWTWQDLLAPELQHRAPRRTSSSPTASRGACRRGSRGGCATRATAPLAALLRASMVRGGGLRIDHVMGLTRLFWVPEGGEPADGAYVRFAGHELLELVALESARAEAIVVGEDLGTVEEGLREELHRRRILSTKVVWFEDAPPEAWPAQSLAMVTTHDLPTIAGMRHGTDAPAGDARPPRAPGRAARRSGRSDDVDREVHHRLGRSPARLGPGDAGGPPRGRGAPQPPGHHRRRAPELVGRPAGAGRRPPHASRAAPCSTRCLRAAAGTAGRDRVDGAPSGSRTHTDGSLSAAPLPVGLSGRRGRLYPGRSAPSRAGMTLPRGNLPRM